MSIRDTLPENIPAQGVQYDVVVRPEIYGRSYIQLAALYEFNGMKKFSQMIMKREAVQMKREELKRI